MLASGAESDWSGVLLIFGSEVAKRGQNKKESNNETVRVRPNPFRYPANIARYKMLKHSKGKANPDRFKNLYSGAKRMGKDGYNSLKYRKVQLKLKKLYTWILVDLPHLKH